MNIQRPLTSSAPVPDITNHKLSSAAITMNLDIMNPSPDVQDWLVNRSKTGTLEKLPKKLYSIEYSEKQNSLPDLDNYHLGGHLSVSPSPKLNCDETESELDCSETDKPGYSSNSVSPDL